MSPTGAPLALRAGWPLYLGMAVAGAAAIVASASTLAGLARTAGWGGWTPWLLPAALDVGGSAGGWCWLRPGAPERARSFGRVVALVGAAATLVGNAAGHLIASGYLQPSPLLVVVVGAVPAAVLMALAHLAALLTGGDERRPRAVRATTSPRTTSAPPLPPARQATEHDKTADDAPTRPLHLAAVRPPAKTTSTPATADVSETRAAVLAAITAQTPTIAELVRTTGRSRTTIVGHLTALTEEGTVRRGADKRYRPADPNADKANDEADPLEAEG